MDGKSLTPEQEKINSLRQVLPEIFTEGKIDWEKLKITLGENINFSNERYVLNWAGKGNAFKILQTPTTKTLIPAKEQSVDFDKTKNIFIEGENLEVLKVLQKSYFGMVKMIYIDPPYNTGSDSFIYPDKFSETKADYEKRVGDKDEEGYMTKDGMFKKNSKENGQYHSNWLNMMMPRLYLAKNLLKKDGVIFVSIDDNEVHNLRLLMNEIFGEENFVTQFIWEKRITRENRKVVSTRHDYIICYSKSTIDAERILGLLPMDDEAISRYKNPDNDPRGDWTSVPAIAQAGHGTKSQFYTLKTPSGREVDPPSGSCWRYTQSKMNEAISDNRIWFGNDGNGVPRIKKFLNEGQQGLTPETIWWAKDVGTNDTAKRELTKLFDGIAVFETPKPASLIKRILQLSQTKDQLCLDFFSGTSPLSEAIMDLNKEDGGNRKYICVQLAELCDEKSEAFKVGYKTIADISKERLRRVGKKIQTEIKVEIDKLNTQIKKLQGELPTNENKTEIENLKAKIEQSKAQDLGFKVLQLEDSNFKQWQQIEGKDTQALAEQIKLFIDPISESATIENMVYELLLKSGKDLNSYIEKKNNFHKINDNELVLLLEKATQEIIDSVIVEKPIKVIALDKLFKGNDQLKTNTVLQMKDAGIEFKTI
ncbi:type III restriction-modification system methylation subunit [Myroides odoratimimus]|uniref:site-specific DNA-methyltransferase n=1 Tax=Myroides odoratimimus TaxID=76832 RepID=UPI0007294ACC|nr:site-specific DNA-methyltransferase [Myroides odoratimimus]GAQ13481.1 type III restriction-modification system methylation subunit [Myroides odoratimimus]STZ48029.1 putative methyltransferase [Myroides odoratimimus]